MILAAGVGVAVLLWYLVTRTRLGMLVRAGSTHPQTVAALGVDVDRLFRAVFAFGAVLAGLAGAMAGPLVSVEPTMGDRILIVAFVVIVIGGIGSIKGAFVAAIIVGLVDTLGRAFAPELLKLLIGRSAAAAAGPALSSMAIYLLMAAVLSFRPTGLFGGDRDDGPAFREKPGTGDRRGLPSAPCSRPWARLLPWRDADHPDAGLCPRGRLPVLSDRPVRPRELRPCRPVRDRAYAVLIAGEAGVREVLVVLPLAAAAAALFSAVTGAIALRTRGVYFIMITLAFAQMAFYVAASLSAYGGDDGMAIAGRSTFFGIRFLKADTSLALLAIALVGLALFLFQRLAASRFGLMLRAARRMRARWRPLALRPTATG